MTTPLPDTATKKKRAALRVFGEVVVDDPGAIDNSLTYSTGSEKSQNRIPVNDENSPNIAVHKATPPKKSSDKDTKSVSFALGAVGEANESNKDLFHCKRSPMRPDLVQRTQEAIRKATISVNETMLIGEKSAKKKAPQIAKSEWKAQVDEARDFNNQMHDSRLRLLALKKELSSKGSREKARRHLAHKSKVLTEIDKESQFKSMVFRDHQKKLREEEERRRRISIDARAKLRANAQEGKERMRMQRIDEDLAIIGERHEASIAMREKQASDAAARRKSFAFRNGDARRIRELHELMEAERQRKSQDDFKLTEQGHRDMVEYKRKLEHDRRQSLAFRNAMAARQRKKEQEQQAKEFAEQQQSFALKFAADRDVDDYKKQMEEERRLSFAKRNKDSRQQRLDEEKRKAVDFHAESESYKLKRQADKDVDEYLAKVKEERHQSFENRGKEHLRQRKIEQERQTLQSIQTYESFELKRGAEKDAQEYLRQLEEDRRKSLAFRNREGRNIRQNEEKRRNEELIKEHESYELKWAGERDAEAYQKEQENARRDSLAFRNKESRTQRKIMSDIEANHQEAEHHSFELKRNAAKDVEEYQKQEADKHRKDLASWNAERAKHAKVMKQLNDISRQKESESFALKWAGENDAKDYLAKLEEERRQSLQLRGKLVLQGRRVEEDLRAQELYESHHTENLRAEDQRAVKEYQNECAARDRSSLQFRGKELNRQRIATSVQESRKQKIDQQNFELERQAQKDVEEYLKECQRRRRMSLALRAKETRKHAAWKRRQKEKQLRQRRQLVHGRLMDQRYAELAQQEERARQALEAIRHETRTSNPFSGLL